MRKRLTAKEKAACQEHRDDLAALKRLQCQNKKLYGEYRQAACNLLSLATVLRQTGGEIEQLGRQVDDWNRARDLPLEKPFAARFPFDVSLAWLHYGLEDGLARMLAYRRKLERLFSWI